METKNRKILPTITTTQGSDWKTKVKEINRLGLKEVALFPTFLNKERREKLYYLINKSSIESIPLVHIRSDMDSKELDFLIRKYKTQVFNAHTHTEFPFNKEWSKYKKKIAIENVFNPLDEKEIKKCGGVCLDVSHLENDRILNKEKFQHNVKILEQNLIVCNHVSAVSKKITHIDEIGGARYDHHQFRNVSEFDYLKKYPKNYFSEIIAIEVENSVEEQLLAREYILNILEV